MALFGWGHRNALVLAKDNKTYDYMSYGKALFYPYEKYFSFVFEIGYILLAACGVSTAIAGAGALLKASLTVPYSFGIVIVGFIILILTIYGGDVIIRVLSYKTYFLVVTLFILCTLGIQTGNCRRG